MSEIAARLARYFTQSNRAPFVASAYLFGSRAAGTAHRDSDVDVGVLLDRNLLPTRAERSRAAIELGSELIAATHHNRVDVVVLNDVSPELAMRVLEDGKRVFCRDPETDFRFRLETRLRYIDLRPFLGRTRALKAEALRS